MGSILRRVPDPIPPGEMLMAEWLTPSGMSQTALAEKMGVHVQLVNQIVRGRRAATAETALKLTAVLKTTPEFWLNLQNAVDLWEARKKQGRRAKAS